MTKQNQTLPEKPNDSVAPSTQVQAHASINIITGNKAKTLEALMPVLNSLPIDEIDDESFEFEIRLYFDSLSGISRVAYAMGRIEQQLDL